MRRWAWPARGGCAWTSRSYRTANPPRCSRTRSRSSVGWPPFGLERGEPFIAIGDETVLEAATFSAAVWLRGVPLIVVPVTTQGLIDTAIGGKGGINLPGVGRNLLGSFHNATAAILDIALTSGEPEADRRAALAEAVKYGLVSDEGILALLENASGFEWMDRGRKRPGCWSSWSAVRWPSAVWSSRTSGTRATSGSPSTSAIR